MVVEVYNNKVYKIPSLINFFYNPNYKITYEFDNKPVFYVISKDGYLNFEINENYKLSDQNIANIGKYKQDVKDSKAKANAIDVASEEQFEKNNPTPNKLKIEYNTGTTEV